uniref:Uncharacterized protein n=1 Tax=viral metagenome TaxID=1070528 RepID=A0A2V0RBT7_9ZZZZ
MFKDQEDPRAFLPKSGNGSIKEEWKPFDNCTAKKRVKLVLGPSSIGKSSLVLYLNEIGIPALDLDAVGYNRNQKWFTSSLVELAERKSLHTMIAVGTTDNLGSITDELIDAGWMVEIDFLITTQSRYRENLLKRCNAAFADTALIGLPFEAQKFINTFTDGKSKPKNSEEFFSLVSKTEPLTDDVFVDRLLANFEKYSLSLSNSRHFNSPRLVTGKYLLFNRFVDDKRNGKQNVIPVPDCMRQLDSTLYHPAATMVRTDLVLSKTKSRVDIFIDLSNEDAMSTFYQDLFKRDGSKGEKFNLVFNFSGGYNHITHQMMHFIKSNRSRLSVEFNSSYAQSASAELAVFCARLGVLKTELKYVDVHATIYPEMGLVTDVDIHPISVIGAKQTDEFQRIQFGTAINSYWIQREGDSANTRNSVPDISACMRASSLLAKSTK